MTYNEKDYNDLYFIIKNVDYDLAGPFIVNWHFKLMVKKYGGEAKNFL